MYSDDSDYDVDESIMSGTYLNIDDAQFVVDQQQIVVTQAIGISRFVHPAAEDRQYKATFYAHKNSGFVVIEELVEQLLAEDGTAVNGLPRTVKFEFNDMTAWFNFVNQLKEVNYEGP